MPLDFFLKLFVIVVPWVLSLIPYRKKLKKKGKISWMNWVVIGITTTSLFFAGVIQWRDSKENETLRGNIDSLLAGQIKFYRKSMGKGSKPVLKFYHFDEKTKKGTLYWDNSDGEDPAQILYARISTIDGRVLPPELPPVTIPAKADLLQNSIQFTGRANDREGMVMDIYFLTMSGQYHEVLILEHDGKSYRSAYQTTTMKGNEMLCRSWIDPAFPKSELNNVFIKPWDECQDKISSLND